ncbi:fructosamine kinase family protein [Alphaproteobacteria bacterium]|nr:fructosamine kinase family protein [Alphaproteobacteria bacterium]
MIIEKHIKEIESLLDKGKIIQFELLQVSFDIACLKIKIENNNKFIVKYNLKSQRDFNAIESEAKNLQYLNKIFNFFPKLINFNKNCLIIEFFENDGNKPNNTNLNFLESIIKMHNVSNNLYGFEFNTQIGGLEQPNEFENSWTNFYSNKRLSPIFELANKKENMGDFINEKINYILKNIKSFIPENPIPKLLHGDLWEGNIVFNNKNFVGFIDPGSFYGHNEMEVAYLRWFNPSFIDFNFLTKYNDYIKLEKNYHEYELIYQLYYCLCNVALWDKFYIKETSRILKELKI